MRIPSSVYRLQLSPGFTLDDAADAAPYLRELGVGDLYLSPILEARPGSEHGYDVTDPTRVREELGGEAALRRLGEVAQGLDMGLVVDVVPNHMAADHRNPWWRELLRDGRASPHAETFDVEWDAPGLDGRVLLPVLGEPLDEAVAGGRLEVVEEDGRRQLAYFDRRFPLAAGSEQLALPELLAAQHYELAFWRDAATRINYRRFFDIADLVALRAEREPVFEATHAKLLELVADGVVRGLRIDHVDGLREPEAYLRRLHERAGDDVYVVVEKILGREERLRTAWAAAGTTGYEFLATAGGLFVDPAGAGRIAAAYAAATGAPAEFETLAVEQKRRALGALFAADLDRVVRRALEALPGAEPGPLREAVAELSAQLPVYRTYFGETPADEDRDLVREAAREARAALGEPARAALDAVVAALEPPLDEAERRFALAWQQLTGPVAAKGVEDTALYVDVRLVARNEPGLDPGWLTTSVEEFHARCAETVAASRHPVNATSTHDTKRSEDVRMRIGALSELAGEWPEAAARWREANAELHRRAREAPDVVEEWLLYQTLVGMWPGRDGDSGDVAARLCAYMTKALREAKRRSSWLGPDEAYEADVHAFVAAVLDPGNEPFRGELEALAERAAAAGLRASLAQLVLKLAAPGVPDVYWGNERVDLSLVDPDNRRPVDFAGRRAAGLDGDAKLRVTVRGLELRRRRPGEFQDGEYVPLTVTGEQAARVVAFARVSPEAWVVAVVPRLTEGLAGWSDTAVRLPDGAPEAWTDALSGVEHAGRMLAVGALLDPLGVALLEADMPAPD